MARILVIDDDQAIAELVKVNLDLLGHQVSVAHDGIKGLALSQQNSPDLIILDVMMPDLDGFTVCQRLRQNPRYSRYSSVDANCFRHDQRQSIWL